MMELEQGLKFVCKLCNKKYPCGKSLGGHMRSHGIANSAESVEKVEPNMKNISSFGVGGEFGNEQTSYGLRENPKKTWRAVDSTNFPLPQERFCKQCGKGFQSMKALCGHMACHSDKDKGLRDDYSWTSENQKIVFDSHSDTEEAEEEHRLRTRSSSKSKRYKDIVVKSPNFSLANYNNNGSSSVSEIDCPDQEEVAMCLMLLSRDCGNKGGVNSVVESSDNNSVVLETKSSSIDMTTGKKGGLTYVNNQDETDQMKKIGDKKLKGIALDAEITRPEDSDSGYFLDECVNKAESDLSVDGIRRNGGFSEYMGYGFSEHRENGIKNCRTSLRKRVKDNEFDDDGGIESKKRKHSSEIPELCNIPQNRSKYECFNCKKSFKSYQALGGHRPCHKRSNAFYESRYESGENSIDDSTDFRAYTKLVESSSNRKSSSKNSPNYADKKTKSKKNKGHVCPFCNRVFKNGQALGGHKRSHFIGGHAETINHSAVMKPEVPDLLDLNLPAPEDDEDDQSGYFFAR